MFMGEQHTIFLGENPAVVCHIGKYDMGNSQCCEYRAVGLVLEDAEKDEELRCHLKDNRTHADDGPDCHPRRAVLGVLRDGGLNLVMYGLVVEGRNIEPGHGMEDVCRIEAAYVGAEKVRDSVLAVLQQSIEDRVCKTSNGDASQQVSVNCALIHNVLHLENTVRARTTECHSSLTTSNIWPWLANWNAGTIDKNHSERK